MKKILPYAFVGMLSVALPPALQAGNIPQYKVGYEMADDFKHLENPQFVKSVFNQHTLIFKDGKEYCELPHTGEGFPIGFTFKLGGKEFTQFAIDNLGAIYLGTEDEGVIFRGQNTMMFMENLPRELDLADEFYLGMLSTGVWSEFKSQETKEKLAPQIGYDVLGEEGNRVLVVEYRNMAPEKEKQSKAAHYDLQIRLYEADNHFEIAFNEVSSPMTGVYGFLTGMRGFEIDDAMLLSAATLGAEPTVSETKHAKWDQAGCRVYWDGANDYDHYYKPVYSFFPETDMGAPEKAPEQLTVVQDGSQALVTLRRAEGSPATVVLYSESPLTSADFPEDGTTFRSQGKFGDYITTIGNATVLYYGDKEEIELTLPAIEDSKDYYFAALSANGYPAFNKSLIASAVLSTAQPAPKRMDAEVTGKNTVKLNWEADDPVIIAVTDDCGTYGLNLYQGEFGRPSVDAKVGDVIPGGGKVIYVGDGSEFVWDELPANGMQYFGAWTVRDGRLSALATPAHACAPATVPYEARLEGYPSHIVPELLTTKEKDWENLGVCNRVGDATRSLRARLLAGQPVEFFFPEIDLTEGDAELSFAFALETDRGTGDNGGGVEVPLGYEPGYFGYGALEVLASDGNGVEVIETISKYPGEMTGNGDGGFVTGTSTFEPVSVDLSALKSKTSIGLRAEAGTFSFLYIKDLKITRVGESGVEEIINAMPGAVIGGQGEIMVMTPTAGQIEVYSIDGRVAARVAAEAGETVTIPVAPGIYIVKGVKVVVK